MKKIKRIIIKIKYMPAYLYNLAIMKLRKISYGKDLVIYGAVFFRGKGKIEIGNHVMITSCRETNPIGGDVKTILYAKEGSIIKIGDGSGLSNTSIVALQSVIIGKNVMIGGNCKIYDHDFHSLKYKERMMDVDPGVKSAGIEIKDGAFIGAHTIILKGVTVGKKSIVGAGSVVTKSIPDGQIWAGNPAKYIRMIEEE